MSAKNSARYLLQHTLPAIAGCGLLGLAASISLSPATYASSPTAQHQDAAAPDGQPLFRMLRGAPVALDLDAQRIAVLTRGDHQAAIARDALGPHGIAPHQVRPRYAPGWSFAVAPNNLATRAGIEDLVQQVAADGIVDFATPVFLDDDGHAMFPTSDVLVRFKPHVGRNAAFGAIDVAAPGHPAAFVDVDWAGMNNVYRLRDVSMNGLDVLHIANALAMRPDVAWAEADWMMHVQPHNDNPPNDPSFPNCWGHNNTGDNFNCGACLGWNAPPGVPGMDMGSLDAWAIETGSPNIIVAVFDNGINQSHPDINQITPGYDFVNGGGDGGPVNVCDGHGTAVGGAVAALMNNNTGGVGVAPGCRVISMKVWNEGPDDGSCQGACGGQSPDGCWCDDACFGFDDCCDDICVYCGNLPDCNNGGFDCVGAGIQASYIINGLETADQIGVRVTNHSYGMGSESEALEDKFAETRADGMVHFASAGNGGSDNVGDPNLGYPARIVGVNAVAALDPDGTLTGFSNFGNGLFISAPGVGVCGTGSCFCGTSASSPSVAGVAALVLSARPSMSAAQVEATLAFSAMDLGPGGYDTTYGWGFVNARDALIAAWGCPGNGNCYSQNGSPGCQNAQCCAEVCGVDSFCCNVEWDGLCAELAVEICLGCPGQGPCGEPHGDPGCSDPFCCQSVCMADSFCCNKEFGWDNVCVALAIDLCNLAPENDDCENAETITDGLTPFDITYAGNDGFSHFNECEWNAEFIKDVWFEYTAECTGILEVSTCGLAPFQTWIAVYNQSACPPGVIPLMGCETDTTGCPNDGALLDGLFVTQGETYLIRIGALNIQDGTGMVRVTCSALWDDCDGAFFLDDFTGSININNRNATTDGPAHASCSKAGDDQINSDIWFDWIAPCTGTVTLSTCGSADFDTKLAIYEGCACPVSSNNLIGCNDDYPNCPGLTSRLTAPVMEGQCYKIRVGGYSDAQGSGQLNISCNPGPSNDDCDDAALTLLGPPTPFTTVGASTDGIHHAECGSQIMNDVWFRRTATCTGFMTVSTCGMANFDTKIAVYDGCACPATNDSLLGCNDNAPNCGGDGSRVTIPVIEGQCYLVRIGAPPIPVTSGLPAPTGTGSVEFTCVETCTGDINLDGLVNVLDLLLLLQAWGDCPEPCGPGCLADFNDDCTVDVLDMLELLSGWGTCFPT